jgi:hypothetical protein
MVFATTIAASVGLLATIVSAQSGAWGQCGGMSWSGATTCVSGYHCVVVNDYYSQCQPGGGDNPAPSTPAGVSSAPPSTTTGGSTSTGTGPGTTLQSGYYWIRAVEAPYFHYYLQSQTLYTSGNAVLGSYTTAGQFQVVDGQLVQLVSSPGGTAQLLYGNVATNTSYNGRMFIGCVQFEGVLTHMPEALQVTFSTSKNTYGTWGWQGDGLTWSTPDIKRPNSIAWYICTNDHLVYLNLGAYLYNTPSGCSDETVSCLPRLSKWALTYVH